MSFQAMAAAVEVDLPGNKKCLLMMMANYADENGFCYPAVSTLALDAGVSERSVQNYLSEFVERGIIEVRTRKTESGSTSSNLYKLNLHKAPQIVRKNKRRNHRGENSAPYPAKHDEVGCNGCGEGVQPFREGGATVAPKPITEPTNDPVIEPDDADAASSGELVADHSPVEPDEQAHHAAIFGHQDSGPAVPAATSTDRNFFSMHWQWMPSEWFSERCRTAGVNLTNLEPAQQESILGEFRSYWESEGSARTQAQWEHKLLRQLQRVPSGAAVAAIQTRQQKRADLSASVMDIEDTSWGD